MPRGAFWAAGLTSSTSSSARPFLKDFTPFATSPMMSEILPLPPKSRRATAPNNIQCQMLKLPMAVFPCVPATQDGKARGATKFVLIRKRETRQKQAARKLPARPKWGRFGLRPGCERAQNVYWRDPMSRIAARLAELGVELPKPAAPVANYVPFVRTSGMAPGALPQLWISGQLPLGPDGTLSDRHTGKLGPDSMIDAAREAARLCAINVLAQAAAALGDLDKVVQVVRLGGYFNIASSFDALPQAMNG